MAKQENNGDGEHLGVGKCPGERPTKILHGKGTDRGGRPGSAIGMFIAILLYSTHFIPWSCSRGYKSHYC